ncbi:hypothetical protein TSAR_008842 [Trichomalopsis sarcophagae]|uniref:CHK kinase-like domain-containing protein n=1 Tax=Trichomalopsis sarcophagae TaxID=543379 RepID=A0A232EHX7_9HYME|nr:hypothetical protein TSAR_008842 [Trichomalopsis sarcophagae]
MEIHKDFDLLKKVSAYFDENTLRKIVAEEKSINKSDIEILSWNFEKISGKGDNYLSVVDRLFIKSRAQQKTLETRIIVKSMPENVFRRKLLRSAEYFRNEIIFYTEISTRFSKYLKSKGQAQLLSIPLCFAYHLDGDNDFIALQDVTDLGFSPISRHACLNYEECKYIIEAIAQFHAISFAYKNEHREEFERIASLLNETFYREDIFETSFKCFNDDLFRIARDALAKEYPGSKGEKVFNSYEPDKLYKKVVDICAKKDAETSVISQGDTWAPNFMMRRTEHGKTEILILDFQIARCASPVLDVVFFIYQCTDKKLRDRYYDTLLKEYYDVLTKTMKLLGTDADVHYSWETFQKEVKEQSLYGLMFALMNVPLSLIPENAVFDLDAIKEEVSDIADLDTLPNVEKAEDRQRLADIILHAVEKEFI